ncbi:SMI1/KNR4 family protein [Amycolatopsis sp. EV170708-02-1]|uniref:SMI1/KNR4 family protein n=1 Tax=Amycolatopsis sp. EV170708-02-1 TaxID=2919322 RepID=UPI001F0B76E3|nr:SMI1/KNR4 family protein [Amycolatopsis sp. EV170708-02-1]UMP07275.1 SMI1/KNR4 family protein [Amycolatopsis sp. EV170708-02-1]
MNQTAREFARLRGIIERELPDAAPFLPGASEHELDRLATETGLVLPAELRDLLSVSAGQDDPGELNGPLNFHHFLTVDEIIGMHRMLTDVVGDMAEPVEQPACLRWTVWSESWLPFLAFQGDCYFLDLAPGELGTLGQVVCRPNVPDLGEPVAPSLSAFLARAADLVEAGHVKVEESTLVVPDLY